MSTNVRDRLRDAEVHLFLKPDGGLAWHSARQPDGQLILEAREHKQELIEELRQERARVIGKYREIEQRLERNLPAYIGFSAPATIKDSFVADLADIDLIEDRLRNELGAVGCISYHQSCTAEQIASRLCCEACRI